MYKERLKKFTNLYEDLSRVYGSDNVFRDFVKMCAISIYNSFSKNQEMEQEYLKTINSYEKEHQNIFPEMFGELVMMYEEAGNIIDILGPFYERQNLANGRLGQVFTPSHISDLIAEISIEDVNTLKKNIDKNGFITMSEPTCGAGRYDTFISKGIKKKKYKLSTRLTCNCNRFVRCLCLYGIYSISFVWNTCSCVLWKYINTRNAL